MITQLNPRLELVLRLLKKSTTSSPLPVFTPCSSRSPMAFHHTLSHVMPDIHVRPFLAIAQVVASFQHCSYTYHQRFTPFIASPPLCQLYASTRTVGQTDAAPWRLAVYLVQLWVHGAMEHGAMVHGAIFYQMPLCFTDHMQR